MEDVKTLVYTFHDADYISIENQHGPLLCISRLFFISFFNINTNLIFIENLNRKHNTSQFFREPTEQYIYNRYSPLFELNAFD